MQEKSRYAPKPLPAQNAYGRPFRQPLRGQPGGQRGPFQLGLTRVQHILDLFLGHVDQRANLRPLFGRQVAQGLHHLGQFAFLAEVVNPDLLQGIDVFGVSHSLQCLRDQRIQVFHVWTPDTK